MALSLRSVDAFCAIILAICLSELAECIKIRQPNHSVSPKSKLRQTSSQNFVQDEDAVYIHASSFYLQAIGAVWLSKIASVEEKVANLYIRDLEAKEKDCEWTAEERNGWRSKLERIKVVVENYTDTSDILGLGEIKNKQNLTDLAAFTLSVSINFETFGRALYLDADSDFVIVKFAAFLREQMVRRQYRHSRCTWTVEEQESAVQSIDEIYEEFCTEMNKEVGEIMQVEPIQVFTDSDRYWSRQIFGTLYESFE